MTIRAKMTWQLTGLFASLLLMVLLVIYSMVSNDLQRNFFKRLEDRAYIVGHHYLAQDNFTKEQFAEVQVKLPRTLEQEHIRIYDLNHQAVFIKEDSLSWDKRYINQIIAQKYWEYKQGDTSAVGIYYQDNSGDFVIIASADNSRGKESLRDLLYAMIVGYLIAILSIILLGRALADLILTPITYMNKHMQAMEVNKLNQRLPIKDEESNDEIVNLMKTINLLFERLQQSFLSQQAFVSNASHELKTPIAALMGNAEIALRKERTAEEYQAVLTGIVQDSSRLDGLIHQLLALAQIDVQIIQKEPFILETMVWEMMDEILKDYPQMQVNIFLNCALPLAEIKLYGNIHLLKIALGNIIHNASKFSDNKEVKITIFQDHQEVCFQIEDQGIGIPPKDLMHIDEAFYRGGNTFGYSGVGLGLSMSTKIIHLHQATINFESVWKEGTTVSIKFPYSADIRKN